MVKPYVKLVSLITPKRSWFQFELRTMLAFVAVVAVAMGVFGVRWYRKIQQDRALTVIQAAGGLVARNQQGEIDRVYLAGDKFDDKQFQQLMPHLQHVWRLRELDLVHNQVSDAGLDHVKWLVNLRELYLFKTKVTREGVRDLEQALPQLAVKQVQPSPIATGMAAREVYDHALLNVAFHPAGNVVASGSGDGILRLWDVARGRVSWATQAHGDWLFAVAFSPDGRTLATGGGDNRIVLWDVAKRRPRAELSGHSGDVHAVAFCDDETLVSVGDDRAVRVWDLPSRKERFVLRGHAGSIPSLALNPDGRIVATASRDDTIRLWDVQAGEPLAVLEGHEADVLAVSFSPDGRRLASASYDQTIRVWDVEAKSEVRALRGHTDWAFAVAFSPDGERIVSGAGDGVKIWDARTGRLLETRNEQDDVSSVRFSAAGDLLATTSAEGNICLRDPAIGSVRRVLWARYGERDLEELAQENRR
jgi:WD40 repeat protein